jgi:hypothetical protein
MIDANDEPVVVVSNDTHIGPRLVEDLRPYCPRQHLDDFDAFTASVAADNEAATRMLEGSGYLDHPNFRTEGHHDSAARLADYDHDGIAAGVLFHGSMNMEPIRSSRSRSASPPRWATTSSRRSACRSTTAGWPTSCRRRPTATSASPTSR